MAEITHHRDETGQITTHVVVGKLSREDVLRTMTEFNTERMTPNVLWDLTEASLVDIRSDDLKAIVEHWKTLRHLREGGKSAFLVQRALELGVVRMFEAHLQINEVPDRMMVFRDPDEALDWLQMEN